MGAFGSASGPSKIPASKRRVDYAVDEGDVVGGGPLAVDEWFSSLPFWGRGTVEDPSLEEACGLSGG